jgi:hypothetical protein
LPDGAPEFLGNPLDQIRFLHTAMLLVMCNAAVCCVCTALPHGACVLVDALGESPRLEGCERPSKP